MPIYTGLDVQQDRTLDCDVCIVGSGAGGAFVAAKLALAGKRVVVLEDGSFHTSDKFDMTERNMVPRLYQERGGRATTDQSMAILQGRAVGGTTVVNWTTCFRTPERVFDHWHEHQWRAGHHARGAGAALGGHRKGAEHRQGAARAGEQEQPGHLARPAEAGLARRPAAPQREELRAHRLLRHGLPHRCQAEHAGHQDPRGRARGGGRIRQRLGRARHARWAQVHLRSSRRSRTRSPTGPMASR